MQKIVEELHYQYSAEAVRTVLNDTSGRALRRAARVRDEGGSRTTTTSSAAVAAVLRAVAMALSSETAPLA